MENTWLYVKSELEKSVVNITTKNDLCEIQSVWRKTKLDYVRNLYQSIPDRLDKTIISD